MNKRLVLLTTLICFIACIGDILITAIFGTYYPGYSQLSDTLSKMGSDISPVSHQMSLWWIVLGSMFAVFGICFGQSFLYANKHVKFASWLFIVYGVGEGISSGLFPMSYKESGFDLMSYLHLGLSGLGVLALIIIPFIVRKIFTKESFPKFYRYSFLVVILGLVFMGLFSIAKSIDDPQNFFVKFKGLWQRILSLNFYIYFVITTVIMVKNISNKNLLST